MRHGVRSLALLSLGGLGALLAVTGASAVSIFVTHPVTVTCTSAGQVCDNAYQVSATTSTVLTLEFTRSDTSCAPFSVELLVDGNHVASSAVLATNESSGTFDAGPVAPGDHLVELRATGVDGGCDQGTLPSWGGRLTVGTNDDVVSTPPPGGGGPSSPDACKRGAWQAFTAPSFKNQGECASYAVHQSRGK